MSIITLNVNDQNTPLSVGDCQNGSKNKTQMYVVYRKHTLSGMTCPTLHWDQSSEESSQSLETGREQKGGHCLAPHTMQVPGEPGGKPFIDDLLLGPGFIDKQSSSFIEIY